MIFSQICYWRKHEVVGFKIKVSVLEKKNRSISERKYSFVLEKFQLFRSFWGKRYLRITRRNLEYQWKNICIFFYKIKTILKKNSFFYSFPEFFYFSWKLWTLYSCCQYLLEQVVTETESVDWERMRESTTSPAVIYWLRDASSVINGEKERKR